MMTRPSLETIDTTAKEHQKISVKHVHLQSMKSTKVASAGVGPNDIF